MSGTNMAGLTHIVQSTGSSIVPIEEYLQGGQGVGYYKNEGLTAVEFKSLPSTCPRGEYRGYTPPSYFLCTPTSENIGNAITGNFTKSDNNIVYQVLEYSVGASNVAVSEVSVGDWLRYEVFVEEPTVKPDPTAFPVDKLVNPTLLFAYISLAQGPQRHVKVSLLVDQPANATICETGNEDAIFEKGQWPYDDSTLYNGGDLFMGSFNPLLYLSPGLHTLTLCVRAGSPTLDMLAFYGTLNNGVACSDCSSVYAYPSSTVPWGQSSHPMAIAIGIALIGSVILALLGGKICWITFRRKQRTRDVVRQLSSDIVTSSPHRVTAV